MPRGSVSERGQATTPGPARALPAEETSGGGMLRVAPGTTKARYLVRCGPVFGCTLPERA